MSQIFAVHEHELRTGVSSDQYEQEVKEALQNFRVPGLLGAYHLKGIKGKRDQKYGVLWIFEDEQALINNFGTPGNPKCPKDWLYYENQVLSKFLDRDPDTIDYTDYHVLNDFQFDKTPNFMKT